MSGIYSTVGDVDYESFHIALKSKYHGRDDAHELAFDTKHKTARDNNQCTTYQVHQSLFYNYGVDTGNNDKITILLFCDNGNNNGKE